MLTLPIQSSDQPFPRRPAFAPLPPAIEDDWGPALLCVALAGLFVVLGLFRGSAAAFGASGLFAALVPILIVMNMTARRIR